RAVVERGGRVIGAELATASTRDLGPPQAHWKAPVLVAVRRTVRALLEASPGWQDAAPDLRRGVARSLVAVGMMAADLAAADQVMPRSGGSGEDRASAAE